MAAFTVKMSKEHVWRVRNPVDLSGILQKRFLQYFLCQAKRLIRQKDKDHGMGPLQSTSACGQGELWRPAGGGSAGVLM